MRQQLFVCVRHQGRDPMALQCLGNRIMEWGNGLWLFDPTPLLPYWRQQAAAAGRTLLQLWQQVLQEALCNNSTDVRAAVAPHPWQALLLFSAMQQQHTQGLLSLSDNQGQQLYRQLDWTPWQTRVRQLARHLEKDTGTSTGSKGWTRQRTAALRSEAVRLQRMAQRLGMDHPAAMQGLHHAGLRRRFGTLLAAVWEWTCLGQSRDSGAVSFPWNDWQPPPPASLTRVPDYALCAWEQAAPLLLDDLDQLAARLRQRGRIHVLELCWLLRFPEDIEISIPLQFRHPHCLEQEMGHHGTILLQLRERFAAAVQDACRHIPGWADMGETILPVLSWRLSVQRLLCLPAEQPGLFGDMYDLCDEEAALRQLENELPVPLHRFRLRDDWEPGESYGEGSVPYPALHQAALTALARQLPLFLLEERDEVPGEALHALPGMHYQMCKWWRTASGTGERACYRTRDKEQRIWWASPNGDGGWERHGLFG